MISDSTQRIISIMKAENMNATQFAEAIGIQRAAMSHIMIGRNKPSADVLYKISERFSTINPGWLLTGKGSMRIIPDNASDSGSGVNNVLNIINKYGTGKVSDMTNNEPDLFYQNDSYKSITTTDDTHSKEDIRNEIYFSDKILERNEADKSKNISKEIEKEVVIYKERPVKTIDKLLIFYSDKTYESFIPEKHSVE